MTGPSTLTPSEVATYYADRVPGLKQLSGREWRGPCPIHGGKRDSFAVEAETGRAHCHSECGRGWDVLGLEQALSGTGFPEAKRAVFELIGRAEDERPQRRTVAEYFYTDEGGRELFRVIRTDPKGFYQQRPDGRGGWANGLARVRVVPFRLDRLVVARSVFIVEGEKDVLALEAYGLVATCNPMGAGKWRDAYSAHFIGKRVAILPDNDGHGRAHALAVAESLLDAGVASVRIVELEGLPEKGDVSDWIAAGGTKDRLVEFVKASPELTRAGLADVGKRWEPADAKASEQGRPSGIATRCIADIEARPISWLWPGRIARGKITIIAGHPGLGKSQLTASIAAIVTTGGTWPVDRQQCERGSVLFVNCEDDPADTLRPRLEAAGACLDRVHVLDGVELGQRANGTPGFRSFNLAEDTGKLGEKLDEIGEVAAVFIDPITAFLGGETDSHKNADVRALLAPLSDLAARYGAAIIGISHLSKGGGQQALTRVSGSMAFVAAARAAYLVEKQHEEPALRLFLAMKNNIGPDSSGLAFRIEAATVQSGAGPIETSRIVWEPEKVERTADEALNAGSGQQEGRSALADAVDWLRDVLEDGPIPAKEIEARAKRQELSMRTVRRAADSLKVEKRKTAMGGGWEWELAKMAKGAEDDQDSPVEKLATFGNLGHLREPQRDDSEVEIEL